jgi:D-alanyl-D-alanine carboxypeptidase
MTKFFKKALLIVSLIILILPLTSQTTFAATEPDLEASSAIAFDEKTGQVLYQNEPNKKVAIGSITKVLTLYLVTEAIHQHKLKWTDELKPTQEQAEMTQDAELTNVHLDVNQSYSVRSLYDAAWIVSSNSAAMMLAQRVSGTQEEFVRLMRKTLSLWGIKKAQIYNVSGLNNSDLKQDMYLGDSQAENKLSANDIAIITKHILDKYPEVLQTTSKQKFTFPDGNEEKTYTSLNLLLNGNRDYQAGYEFDGLKTGTTVQAGDSFIGTLPMDNTRIVTVTMNVKGE